MTAVQLVNLALLKVGVTKGIAATDEQSREAYTAAQVFDHLLRSVLRAFPWPFATKYLALTQTQGPADADATNVQAWADDQLYKVGDVVEHDGDILYAVDANDDTEPPDAAWTDTPTTQANNDWQYAYRWPSDCLFARRLVPEGGRRQFSETPITYRIGRDANGLLIYTNQPNAELEYTVIDCDRLWADDLFIEAFTWLLAAHMAPSMAKDAKIAAQCWSMYQLALEHAATVATREHQPEKHGDAEWTNYR